MTAPDAHDPWESLADSLGASPAHDDRPPASPPADRPPQPAARKPRQPARSKPPATTGGSWDDLASELGVAGGGEATPRPPRPAAPPPRPVESREALDDYRREAAPPRDDRPPRRLDDDRPPRRDDDATGDRPAGRRRDDEPRGGDAKGDRRGGRRRPRGRGRGRGDGERTSVGEGSGLENARRDGDRGPDEFEAPRLRDDSLPAARRDSRPAADADLDDDTDTREPRGDATEGQAKSGDDESRPRRRRRRGRRGGRGRSRSEAGREGTDRATDRATEPRDAGGKDDDAVPTAYGMRPPARPADGTREAGDRPAASREGGDSSTGEGRGRRRRRRGGESRSRGAAGGEADRGRRRSRDQRQSSRDARSSTLSRGRRDDFAPVAGRHDDDDEGLEFLGIEEAGQDASRRQRAPEDDEILAESGLGSVLEVPSWVEAIGIVIAGNLDARNKGRGGDRSR